MKNYKLMSSRANHQADNIHEFLSFVANMMNYVGAAWSLTNDMEKGVIPNKIVSEKDKIDYFDISTEDIHSNGEAIRETMIKLNSNSDAEIADYKVYMYGGALSVDKNDGEMYYYDKLPTDIAPALAILPSLFHVFDVFHCEIQPVFKLKGKDKIKWRKIQTAMEKIISMNLFRTPHHIGL